MKRKREEGRGKRRERERERVYFERAGEKECAKFSYFLLGIHDGDVWVGLPYFSRSIKRKYRISIK
jgi:hypothetical protein